MIFVEPQQLPVNGTYTIVLDPSELGTGQATTNAYNVVDVSGSVTINGLLLPVTINSAGSEREHHVQWHGESASYRQDRKQHHVVHDRDADQA